MMRDALSVYERICKREVVLCGYFGFRNVGDALLADAFRALLKKEGYGRIHLLSAKHPTLRAFLALHRGYDLLLGGGNLLQDATSRRSLWFYLFCASRAKGRVRLHGGLGPLSPEGEARVRPLLARADAFFCRTVGDLLFAQRLGAKTAHLSADAVLSLHLPEKKNGERILLAFKAPKREEEPALLALALTLCRKHGRERCFLYVMHPEDRKVAKRISHLCRIPVYDEGADGFLFRLAACRAVVATRLHAGIAALALGVPFLLGAEEEKCRFFIEDLRALPCDTSFCDLFSLSACPDVLPPFAEIERACRLLQERI
jgi:polysaccharide pyruvyl transferase WcaK-like protein